MKKTTPLFLALLFCINISAQEHLELRFTETELTKESKQKLLQYISAEKNSSKEYTLERFLDKNENLAELRIIEVQKILENEDKRISKSVHYTSSQHVPFECKEKSDLDFFRIQINPSEIEVENSLTLENTEESIDIEPVILKEYVYHLIDPKVENTLYLAQGTVVKIPKNCFVNAKGKLVEDSVFILTQEIMTKADALLKGMTTNLETGYLESRGMIDIQGYDINRNEISFGKDKEIEIEIPSQSQEVEKGFQVYNATQNSRELSWQLTENRLFTKEGYYRKYLRWGKLNKKQLANARRSKDIREMIMDTQGRSKRSIRRTKKRCRRSVRRMNRRYEKRPTKSLVGNERRLKMTNTMIMGDARKKWQLDSTLHYNFKFESSEYKKKNMKPVTIYRFARRSFGIGNIDRPVYIGPRNKNLIVKNQNQNDIQLFFRNRFVILRGTTKTNKTIFKGIPDDIQATIISSKKLNKDEYLLGYKTISTGSKDYNIEEFQTLSKEEYENAIASLTGLNNDLSALD